MLADLAMTIRSEEKNLDYRMSSNFQGALMERIDREYASQLHHSPQNPYSLCITGQNPTVWHVRTITDEAYKKIILPLMDPNFNSLIVQDSVNTNIEKKELKTLTEEFLLNELRNAPCDNRFQIFFDTPTAFKTRGKYWIFPDIQKVFQSLLKKHEAFFGEFPIQENLQDQIQEYYEPNRYHLYSAPFPMEGIFIPGFQGFMQFRLTGPENLNRIARLLLRFGEFSGIGVKCSIGMGAVRLQNGE